MQGENLSVHYAYLAAEFFVDLIDLKEKFLLEILGHVQTIGDQRRQLKGDIRIGLTRLPFRGTEAVRIVDLTFHASVDQSRCETRARQCRVERCLLRTLT